MISKIVKNYLLSSLLFVSLSGMTEQKDGDSKQVVQRESAVETSETEISSDGNALQIGDAKLVFGTPTSSALQARAAHPDGVITVHVKGAESNTGEQQQIEEDSENKESGWCSKIKNCFSSCRRNKIPEQNRPSTCAYIFCNDRCIKIIFSAAMTTIPAGISVYGATRFLDVFLEMGGNTAILTELFLGGLTYTVFLIATQVFICSLCEGYKRQGMLDGIYMSFFTSVPATAIRMWFYMYQMAQDSDPSLMIPVIVYNVGGALYLLFGIYKETCSPGRNLLFGKPLSDCLKIVFKNPFNAVLGVVGYVSPPVVPIERRERIFPVFPPPRLYVRDDQT